MGIQTGQLARVALRKILDEGHGDQRFALQELGPDFRRTEPEGWLWKKGCKRPGLRDPKAYGGLAPEGSELSKILHLPPADALKSVPKSHPGQQNEPTSTAASGVPSGVDIGNPGHSRDPYTAAQIDYLRKSIDVTMKGGIASGVIYPLALCELAREFRIRNVGGASAGAIAASFAAAAELGRARTTVADQPAPLTAIPSATEFVRKADPSEGRCRQGFAGLADMIAWLAQVDDDEKAKEEFRTAQLFKPVGVTLPIFRLLAALMRNRLWALPVLIATSFGARMRYTSLAFVIVLPAVLLVLSRLVLGELPVHWLWAYAVTTVWLLALSLTFFGLILGLIRSAPVVKAWRHSTDKEPAGLELPIPDRDRPPRISPAPAIAICLLGVVILVVVGNASVVIPWVGYPNSVLAWLIGILAVLGMAIASLVRLLRRGKIHRYGLVGGATRKAEQKRLGSPFSRLMGMPRVTVGINLTDWLDQCLSDLSGTTEVLRFGHLWSTSYEFSRTDSQPATELELAASNADHRLVNLELMATELVHRVPYKFPLDDGDPQLYFCKDDLVPIFPKRVIDALCVHGPDTSEFADTEDAFLDAETGRPVPELYRLPKPRDLPVVFAVRISMAFPGLFEAIRLYRRTATDTLPIVRDDFGAPIAKNGKVLTYPQIKKLWIQELWFSDGGITSNFPIHFFDTVLPLWPTVGINLGPHPKGFGHQDVYLPTDRQASRGVPATMGPSVVSMFAALFDTARNWRDTAQTFMPASRGRVAWVRQRKYEGGMNLFMPRDCIATLAMRGAVAGARLRRRFAAQGQWQRHQWLRLRVGLDNLSRLDSRIQNALRDPFYDELAKGPGSERVMQAVFGLLENQADPTPAGLNPFTGSTGPVEGNEAPYEWYEPSQTAEFWTSVQQTLYANADALSRDESLNTRIPTPAAVLRQVPAP
jgi:predicted acylesterase/phospholipase RssA